MLNEPLILRDQVYELTVAKKVFEVLIKIFKQKGKIDEIDELSRNLITSRSSQH